MTGYKKVFVDTAPFIYYLEKSELYYGLIKPVIIDWYKNNTKIVTSALTIEEYCVNPYRMNEPKRIKAFEKFMDYMEIDVVNINRQIAKKAAYLRVEYKGFKAMDALQLATAIVSGCDMFFTNDKQLRQEKELPCMTMEDLQKH